MSPIITDPRNGRQYYYDDNAGYYLDDMPASGKSEVSTSGNRALGNRFLSKKELTVLVFLLLSALAVKLLGSRPPNATPWAKERARLHERWELNHSATDRDPATLSEAEWQQEVVVRAARGRASCEAMHRDAIKQGLTPPPCGEGDARSTMPQHNPNDPSSDIPRPVVPMGHGSEFLRIECDERPAFITGHEPIPCHK